MFKHITTTAASGKKKNQFIFGQILNSQVLDLQHRKFCENDHHDDSNESSKSINKMNIPT